MDASPGSGAKERPILLRAHRIVNIGGGDYAFTDLRKTDLGGVQGRQFRFFTPVRRDRMRLPTSLPEFAGLRHVANLSDSPVTVAAELGGHWSEYNLAAITHVAACNFRCSYCYVDYRHLAGQDAFITSADGVVDEFLALRRTAEAAGKQLSLLRVSGGEPLLAPSLVIEIYRCLAARDLLGSVVLKVESNLSALPYAWQQSGLRLSAAEREELRRVKVHTTLHHPPGSGDWPAIRDGIVLALELGFDLFPAVGASDWTAEQLDRTFHELALISPGLPQRLAVRPFHLDYPALADRRKLPLPNESEAPSMVWEEILRRHTGVGYLDEPRHLVPLS
ncbi:radical SAM protein [Micromonospora chaiyaphumensis]|uniref:Wyosine [tRNA(Phe)-imidazoG37] synthetase, radical SAM superfamily n=1 Tax=Micromonospora chaiyaphumensis TaxID=307119 RepID=A0A1C4W6R1_9ACTN|nr:radical SAM protein [Micromonospora chaiyaphumensis]SCE91868.1 Wyosine [tRNA(Phe)-imidazoG37] synthetase, radical SAM superfamily [Micromonospora chaiyaphumensis]